ncbi:MAG: hypothetical protein ACJ72Q_18780 [Nitrososphaeraceae archaeon]
MMMGHKTTVNADTLMTKIRNMDNTTINSGHSNTNMTNASTTSDVK